jgi:hypothetical protein
MSRQRQSWRFHRKTARSVLTSECKSQGGWPANGPSSASDDWVAKAIAQYTPAGDLPWNQANALLALTRYATISEAVNTGPDPLSGVI